MSKFTWNEIFELAKNHLIGEHGNFFTFTIDVPKQVILTNLSKKESLIFNKLCIEYLHKIK